MNASLVGRYLFRNLVISTVIATVIVSLVAWLIASLKFFELAVNGGLPASLFITLVLLQMPKIVAVVLPIIFFGSIAFVYNKLTAESELIVLRAAGLSQWRLAMPALALGVMVAALVFILNAFAAPLANERMKTLEDVTRAQFAGAPLSSGAFNSIGDKMMVYVRAREANGDLRGILIYQEQPNGPPMTTVAKRGVLADGDNGPEIIVYGFSQQSVDPTTGRPKTSEAASFAIPLQQAQEALTARWKEPAERTLIELMMGARNEGDLGHEAMLRAEAHNRIASPFFSLALTTIGLYALLGGRFDRRGQARRILAGGLGVLAIELGANSLSNLARSHWAAVPLLYLAALAPVVIALVLFARANDGLPPWRRWLAQRLRRGIFEESTA